MCDLPTMAFLRRLLIALCACTARAVLPMPLPPLLPMPALGPQIFNAPLLQKSFGGEARCLDSIGLSFRTDCGAR